MSKYVFGFYWRTVLYILCLSFMLSPFWSFLQSDGLFLQKNHLPSLLWGDDYCCQYQKGRVFFIY